MTVPMHALYTAVPWLPINAKLALRPRQAYVPSRAGFAEVVSVLAKTGNWAGVRTLLQCVPPLPRELPAFLDSDLQFAVWEHLDNGADLDADADKRFVAAALFPSSRAVAQYVDAFAPHATGKQIEELLAAIVNMRVREPRLCTDTIEMTAVLEHLSEATVARLTARTLRLCITCCGATEAAQLLRRRPDLDINTLLDDGMPAWFTEEDWITVLDRAEEESVLRINVDAPFVAPFGSPLSVAAPLLQHVVCCYATEVQSKLRRKKQLGDLQYVSEELDALEDRAAPLPVAVASAPPLADCVLNAFQLRVRTEKDADDFLCGWQVNANQLAAAGLLLRPADVAVMTARLGAGSLALAGILKAFAKERWKRRMPVMQVLLAATQVPDGETPAASRRARVVQDDQPPLSVLAALLRDWDTHRAPPVDSTKPYGLGNELAGIVVSFLA